MTIGASGAGLDLSGGGSGETEDLGGGRVITASSSDSAFLAGVGRLVLDLSGRTGGSRSLAESITNGLSGSDVRGVARGRGVALGAGVARGRGGGVDADRGGGKTTGGASLSGAAVGRGRGCGRTGTETGLDG